MQYKHVLIIGLDGGTFALIRPWAEQGYLPNLKRLLDQGVSCDLLSTLPPVTSPAWPSFMTGMNPGKHGVFDFIRPKGTTYDMVNSTSIQQPTVWDRLAAAGVRVGVVNIPVTYPPHPLKDGFMITGLLSPRQGRISYPDDLIARYEKELGPYRIAPEVQYTRGQEDAFIADLREVIQQRGKYSVALMEHEPWDVMMVVYGSTDIGSHALWHFADETHPQHNPDAPQHHKTSLRDVYALVDEQIGKMLAAAPEDTAVLVMSDHGFGPLHYTVNLNFVLMQAGLMHLKRTPLTQIKAFLFRNGITPKSIYRLLEKLHMNNLAARVSKGTRNAVVSKFLSYDDVDWERTKAFSMGHVGQIYINVKGLHPQGIVEPGTEEWEVRQQVLDALEKLRHPVTGQPVVDKIILRTQEFSGPFAENAPDLQVVLDNYRCISFPLFATTPEVFTGQIRGDSGSHRREGIFIASGPGIHAGETREAASILDVAPTIMYLLGQPVPVEMDGHPLTDILLDPHGVTMSDAEVRKVDPETGLSVEETEEIRESPESPGLSGGIGRLLMRNDRAKGEIWADSSK